MKIQVLCDLHVEFGDFDLPDVGADLVILAGDTHVKDKGLKWVLDQGFKVPVIYVLGNHEFYRDKFPGLIDKLKRNAASGCALREEMWRARLPPTARRGVCYTAAAVSRGAALRRSPHRPCMPTCTTTVRATCGGRATPRTALHCRGARISSSGCVARL